MTLLPGVTIEEGTVVGAKAGKDNLSKSSVVKTITSKKPRLSFDNYGGERGIRTHGAVTDTSVFKTDAINHSAISPRVQIITITRER